MIPRSMDQYMHQFARNATVTGYGADVCQHLPCPWCCQKDFMLLHPVHGIFPGDTRPNMDVQMTTEATCKRCHRSGKNIVERTPDSVAFEFVQTGGPDAPEWLKPAPRRIDERPCQD